MPIDNVPAFTATHLGIHIAGENPGRIIGMPTSEVYSDPELITQLLQIPKNHLDNGIQAQLYVDHDDTLVVYYAHVTQDLIDRVSKNILVNSCIWKKLTGISIQPQELVIAFETSEVAADCSNKAVFLTKGSLLSASIEKLESSKKSILGFVFSSGFVHAINLKNRVSTELQRLAILTDSLMDKNVTMSFLSCSGITVPKTYTFERNHFSISQLDGLDQGNFVFKPSGGAAGIGLFPRAGTGASVSSLKTHLRDLHNDGKLPGRFQIQEFIEGSVWGIIGVFFPGKKWKLLQIHTQQMDKQGRFIGARWSPSAESERLEFAKEMFSGLANLKSFDYVGLIEFDLIGEKLIEVNPRITASSPICHLLSLENKLQNHRGKDFHLKQIDINTQIQFPENPVKQAKVVQHILKIQKETKMLILPQGINPIGKSRVLFVNDKQDSRFQFRFLEEMNKI